MDAFDEFTLSVLFYIDIDGCGSSGCGSVAVAQWLFGCGSDSGYLAVASQWLWLWL
jgi:hypothetical protein